MFYFPKMEENGWDLNVFELKFSSREITVPLIYLFGNLSSS
jgi:hypothetical protein